MMMIHHSTGTFGSSPMNVARVTLRDLGDEFCSWSTADDAARLRRWAVAGNAGYADEFHARWAKGESWGGGATAQDLRGWLRNGYELTGVTFQDDDLVALRERPRWSWSDSEGDYHHDLFLSGVSECYSYKRNRPSVPGVRVHIEMSVDSHITGEACSEWGAFVIRSLSALEAAGIDMAVYARITSQRSFKANETELSQLLITCKREGEAMDYRYFSPIFSPVGFRMLGFFGLFREADSYKRTIRRGLGATLGGSSVHKVTWDADSGAILFVPANNSSTALDSNRLTAELLTALDESRKG